MRIAVDLRPLLTPFESGVAVYTKGMITALKTIPGLDLDLFYQSARPFPPIHEQFPEVRHIPISNTKFHLRSIVHPPKLPAHYFNTEPDLIWMPDRRPFYKTEIPVVMTIHDAVPEAYAHTASLKSRLWHFIFSLRRHEKHSAAFIFPTQSVAQEIQTSIPHAVTYEGVSLSESSKAPKDFKLSNYHLCIASSDPRKRMQWVIEAAKALPEEQFVIAGLKEADPRFPKMHWPKLPNLKLIGAFTDEEKRHLIEKAKSLLAVSEYEGFDLPILEAIELGTPVIMSDIPVHRELYSEGVFVLNQDMLNSAIQGQLSIPVAKQQYTWKSAAEKVLLLFHRVVTNKD